METISIQETWNIYRLGLKKPLRELVAAITGQGFEIRFITPCVPDLLSLEKDLKFNDIEEDVSFALVSPDDLGLKKGWTRKQYLDAALGNGLILPLSGDILEILGSGRYQPVKERSILEVGMMPIHIGTEFIYFVVGCSEDRKYLSNHNGNLEQRWEYNTHPYRKHLFRIQN